MEKVSELKIIKEIRNGNTEAYKTLVDEYSAPIFSFIRGIIINYQDSQEITQEVFVKAYFSLNKYRGDSSFFSWIYSIAYNMVISHLRHKNKKGKLDFIDNIDYQQLDKILDEDNLNNNKELDLKLQKLKEALSQLKAEEQIIITQFYFKDKSIKDLASICNISESNVKIKLFRIKKHLYKLITK